MVERRRGKTSKAADSGRPGTRGGGRTAAGGPGKPAARRGKAKAAPAPKASAKQVVGGVARNGGPAKASAGAAGSKTRQATPARKGVRADGRRSGELRPVRVTPNYSRYAEGSVLIEMGHTRVLCSASVEAGVPRFLRDTGSGWVTAEYGMLPRSTHTRSSREVSRGRVGGRTSEIQRLIGRSLRAIVDLQKLGERTIWIDCDVLQADGGTRTASITGAFIALGLAVDGLLRSQAIKESPLREPVAAISVGIVDGRPAVDLCYEEDSAADVDMNIVMTGSGRFVEVQGTAERNAFTVAQMARMTQLAAERIADLCKVQRTVLAEAGVVLPKARSR